jgi:uncharacterized protein
VEVNLPMEVKLVTANEALKEDAGKVAVQRGPLTYCVEWTDNDGRAANILIPKNASFQSVYDPNILNGVSLVKTEVPVIQISDDGRSIATKSKTVTLIPYYAWANRGKGEMMIWFPTQVKDVDVITTTAEENSRGK